MAHNFTLSVKKLPARAGRWFGAFWRRGPWHKLAVILVATGLLSLASMYGIARWYMATQADKPMTLGATFIPAYAESLGLEAQKTMDAMINDLEVRRFRLVSYWNQTESREGTYDFSLLDWQFEKAEAAHAKVSLALGLRQPRWPECHMPEWAANKPQDQWQPQLENYIVAVVNRYKKSPSLDSYQLENEFFNHFGHCSNFDRQRLQAELDLVKKTDPHHPVILSRSNNFAGLPLRQPIPDIHGISIYRRIWSPLFKRYLQYPFPAWYYGFLAGAQQLTTGKPSIIHELQLEAWPPEGKNVTEISLAEQNNSINAERMQQALDFAQATGIRTADLWGAEYWYYRKVKLHDPSLWDAARDAFHQAATKAE